MDPGSLVLSSHLFNSKANEGLNKGANRMRHLREVGEIRFVAIVIQSPSGLGNPGTTHPLAQRIWKWAEVGPGEGSP